MPFNFFSDVMRTFLGLSPRGMLPADLEDEYSNHAMSHYDEIEEDNLPHNQNNLDMFNEVDEMHKIFQNQFNDIMKLFGMQIGESFDHQDHFFEENRQLPPQRSIRDEYLKSGYVKKSPNENSKLDTDIDGKIAPSDLKEFIDNYKDISKPYDQYKDRNTLRSPGGGFFGRVVITQTTTRPDGTIETRRTVRDSQNNEETTVTIRENDNSNRGISQFNPNFPTQDPTNMWEKFFKKPF